MRLLFEHGFAPTHAFGFYRWLREDFGAQPCCTSAHRRARIHARQADVCRRMLPDRSRDLPNMYLYASNNRRKAHAKRRAPRLDQLPDAAVAGRSLRG